MARAAEEGAPSYASAAAILADALEAFLPPDSLSVAEYAAEHRWLANEGGGYVGRWRHEQAPYTVEPMECLTSLDHLTVAVVGPGQSAKTTIAENWLLASVGSNPGDMLWYMQTDQGVEAYVKGRINPMIDGHDVLRSRQGLRAVDDSLHFKRFRSMKVEFLSATASNLINKSAPRIVADETDAYPPSLGDVKTLLDVRRQTFGQESMLLAISHPDRAKGLDPARHWTDGIMAIYGDSDRRLWWWPCASCGAWSSPNPLASRVMVLDYPVDGTLDEIEAASRLICPVNGCVLEEHHRRQMIRLGRWVGEGQEIAEDGTVTGELVRRKTAGFWIVGLMSPFIIGGMGGLARARVKAEREREASGDDETLRQVMVKQWGVPYQPPRAAGSIDANELAARAEPDMQLGEVPLWARFLTAAWDVQAAHFEVMVRAWGPAGESGVIDRFRVPGEPAVNPADWDKLLELVLQRSYPLADRSGRRMAIRGVGWDLGGLPGVTRQAYDAWTRWQKARAVRFLGTIAGRHVFSALPLQGANRPHAARLAVVYPDTARKSNKTAAAGTVPVARFNPNLFKDDLAGQLGVGAPGDWYVHLPAALRSPEPPHLWFEQLVAEKRNSNGQWQKVQAGARNEALDLMVMNHVVAHLHGLSRIDWERPPAWAAPWDKNSMISAAPEAAPAGGASPPSGNAETPAPKPAAVTPLAAVRRSIARRLA